MLTTYLCQTLSDFRPSGALTYISYGWLWFLAFVAVAVYGSDTFTAVNLLAYDKWSSQIQPSIPLEYSRWIFAVCIIISWVLCAFEWIRALRVIRRDAVAESYMDPLAVVLQSMRPHGWKRFLVFAELTKSKKGLDYIALFVYFQLKGSLRIIVAEAPRQVVNAVTLYSVLQADLLPTGDNAATDGRSDFEQFWVNLGALASSNREQAVVLFTMLFTLCIWVVSALSLITAVVLYLVFLWHHIPQRDGRLSIYCRRKIDRRLTKVVSAKVKQALEDEEKKRLREGGKSKPNKSNQNLRERPEFERKPTVPIIGETTPRVDDGNLLDFKFERQDSLATVSSFDAKSLPSLPRQPTLPDIRSANARPGMLVRSETEASNFSTISHESDAPLLRNATDMGFADDYVTHPRPIMGRQTSGQSSASYGDVSRQVSASPRPPIGRKGSSYDSRPGYDRQDSGSTYGSRPPIDRRAAASPYGPPSIMDRQISNPHLGSRNPNLRAMTPVTEVSGFSNESERMRPGAATFAPPRYYTPPPGQRYEAQDNPPRALMRQGTQESMSSSRTVPMQPSHPSFHRPFSPPTRAATAEPSNDRFSPAPARFGESIEMMARPPPPVMLSRSGTPSSQNGGGGYVAFNPSFNSSANAHGGPRRNMTGSYNTAANTGYGPTPQRSATAPPEQAAYDGIIDEYRSGHHQGENLPRSATAGPRW